MLMPKKLKKKVRCPSKKENHVYRTRLEAKYNLAILQGKGHDVKRFYYCLPCRGFHITSQK